MKKKLTVRGINALKPADPTARFVIWGETFKPADRYVIWDSEVPNFGIRVTDAGKASFIVMRRVAGKLLRRVVAEHRVGVEYSEGMLTQAREAAREALREMGQGVDPKAKREAERKRQAEAAAVRVANSFAVVAEEFIARHISKLRSGPESAATIRREIVSAWGARPIVEITRRDVAKLLERIVDEGHPYVAHKVAAHLSKLFNWAIARDEYGLTASPVVRGISKEIIGAKKPRERVLSDSEIAEIWTATGSTPYPNGPFVRMLLVTGQRLREVANARWNEFDLDMALWTIPAGRAKSDSAHEVPLSPLALEILRSLPRVKGAGAYVFSTTTGKRPISGFSKSKTQLDRKLAEARDDGAEAFAPWVYHDCRRTMRTRMSGLPIAENVAELVIAHAKKGLQRVYDQHAYRAEKARALALWGSELLSIVNPERGGRKVVPLIPASVLAFERASAS